MPEITSKKLAQNRTQFTITFADDDVSKAEQSVVAALGSSVRVPGFREGKAPPDMVRDKLDPERVFEEIVRTLVTPLLRSLPQEHTLKPIVAPKVDVQSAKPLRVALTYVERPEVKVKADKIEISKKETKVEEKDIDRMVQYLVQQECKTKEIERAAKEGDQVTIDFHGTDAAGQEVAGIRTRGYGVIIGSKTLLPGFEEALVGMKRSDEKKVELTFPEDYHAEHLRKKPVTFHVTVAKVEEVETPAFTDAFAQERGLGKSAAEVKERIEQSLRDQEESLERSRRERELFEAIRNATKVDVAPELVEETQRQLLMELEGQLQERKISLEDWMKKGNKKTEDVLKELEDQAKKRLQLRFGVEQLLEDRKIEVTDEEMAPMLAAMKNEPGHEGHNHGKGSDEHEQLKWQKRVEKLVEQLLA